MNEPKYKYIVEELTGTVLATFFKVLFLFDNLRNKKGADDIAQVYAGFGDECKMEDLDSLKSYKLRLTIEIDDNTTTSRSTEWTTFMTCKEPFSIAVLNSAVKRDDGVKVRTILSTESVIIFLYLSQA